MKNDSLRKDYMRYAGKKMKCQNFKNTIGNHKVLIMLF